MKKSSFLMEKFKIYENCLNLVKSFISPKIINFCLKGQILVTAKFK